MRNRCSPSRRTAPARRRNKPPAGTGTAPAHLNGTYRYVLTREDAEKVGDPEARTIPRSNTITLKDGHLEAGCFGSNGGTYSVDDDRITFDSVEYDSNVTVTFSVDDQGNLHFDARPAHRPGQRVRVLLQALDEDRLIVAVTLPRRREGSRRRGAFPRLSGSRREGSLRAPRPGRRDRAGLFRGRVSVADTVVLDHDPHLAIAGRYGYRDPGCGGVLRDVRKRLRAEEIRDRLELPQVA